MMVTSAQQMSPKAADYALDNLPLNDPALQNSKFVDFVKKETQDFSQTSGIFCCRVVMMMYLVTVIAI